LRGHSPSTPPPVETPTTGGEHVPASSSSFGATSPRTPPSVRGAAAAAGGRSESPRLEMEPVEVDPGVRLRVELQHVGISFKDFDKKIGEEARTRKVIAAQHMKDLRGTLGRLEETLDGEGAERAEQAARIEQAVEQRLDAMVQHLSQLVLGRFERLMGTLEGMVERCSLLERGIAQFRGEVPSKLRVESAALRQEIRKLAADFSVESRQLLDEDGALRRRVEAAERQFDERLTQEQGTLESRREALLELLDQAINIGNIPERKHRMAELDRTFTVLEDELTQEGIAREQADDRVVQAINECMEKLHRGLWVSTA